VRVVTEILAIKLSVVFSLHFLDAHNATFESWMLHVAQREIRILENTESPHALISLEVHALSVSSRMFYVFFYVAFFLYITPQRTSMREVSA
jgi:hypothetical protein